MMSGTKLFNNDTLPTEEHHHAAGVLFNDDDGKADIQKVAVEVARQRAEGLTQNGLIESTHKTCNYTKAKVTEIGASLVALTDKSNKWTHAIYVCGIVLLFLYNQFKDKLFS